MASCEKTPSEPGANQSGSATSEAQQNQSAQAQQRGTEEPIKQSQPGEAQQHSSQTAREVPVEEKEQQSKEGQHEQGAAQDRYSNTQDTHERAAIGPDPPSHEDRAGAPSQSSAQTGPEDAAPGQAQQNHLQPVQTQ